MRGDIDRRHRQKTSTEDIDRTHRQKTSTEHIDRRHRQKTSTEDIDRRHRQDTSTEDIDRTHRQETPPIKGCSKLPQCNQTYFGAFVPRFMVVGLGFVVVAFLFQFQTPHTQRVHAFFIGFLVFRQGGILLHGIT
jgi:hypothetical protein